MRYAEPTLAAGTRGQKPARDLLHDIIEGHVAADVLEERHRTQCLRWLEGCSAPFDRYAFRPGHATASAFVVHPEARLMLFLWHVKLQRWLQPGGHAEPWEDDMIDVALREVREETGLSDVRVQAKLFDVDVHDIPASPKEPAHVHFDFRFLVKTSEGTARPGGVAGDGRWFTAMDAHRIATDESLGRPLRKCLAARLLEP